MQEQENHKEAATFGQAQINQAQRALYQAEGQKDKYKALYEQQQQFNQSMLTHVKEAKSILSAESPVKTPTNSSAGEMAAIIQMLGQSSPFQDSRPWTDVRHGPARQQEPSWKEKMQSFLDNRQLSATLPPDPSATDPGTSAIDNGEMKEFQEFLAFKKMMDAQK